MDMASKLGITQLPSFLRAKRESHGRKKEKGDGRRKRDRSQTASFSDGRQIDMVLSYKPLEHSRGKRAVFGKYRRKFESELRARGLELEYESKDLSRDGRTAYVKIHAPLEVLARQAEMRRLRKPTKPCDLQNKKRNSSNACAKFFKKIFEDPFRLQEELKYPVQDYFTEPFRRKMQDQFAGWGDDEGNTFFTAAERAWLTWDAMMSVQIEVKRKTNFIERPLLEIGKMALDPTGKFGSSLRKRPSAVPRLTSEEPQKADMPAMIKVSIDYLLEMNVYEAAYPLHDCDLHDYQQYEKHKKKWPSGWPLSMYLYESWVRPRQLFREQPLDAIRDYFGEQVALYFAWLGYYTKMLIAPAIVGILVLIYGAATIGNDELSKMTCNNETYGRIIVCRNCPYESCDFKFLVGFCRMAMFETVVDNDVTVFFSFFTAIWAVFLLTGWKRYRAVLMTRWNVSEEEMEDVANEPARPQYEMTAPDRRLNPVTGKYEPYVGKRARVKKLTVSVVTIMLCLLVAIGLVVSMMVYRVLGPDWWSMALGDDDYSADFSLIVSVTSSLLTGIFIGIMSMIYQRLAVYLTRVENPRTESEYERSYTYKVVIFECCNYYGSLFYLAFIRALLTSPPQEQSLIDVQCPLTGCLLDVAINLAVIYSGKQLFDTVVGIVAPVLKVCLRRCFNVIMTKNKNKNVRWEEDYQLAQPGRLLLFSEYRRLFIQYGFVTMFLPAFPLAPLFALLNNILEIRLDAYRMLVLSRRNIPTPVRRPTVWHGLTRVLSRAAILTNALLIGVTSDFIPRLLYIVGYADDWTLSGYVDHILSQFNTSDWPSGGNGSELAYWHATHGIVDQCYYRDYRVSPWTKDPHGLPAYSRTKQWWHVLVARLAFILLFEHLLFLLHSIIEYSIPPVPASIVKRRKREQHLEREKFLNRGK